MMNARNVHRNAGFTLTELMIAVAVLVVVLLGTSKIFSTTSEVVSKGAGVSDLMQEASAVERQLRHDFKNLCQDGVLVIRSYEVPNDINASLGYGLLNPTLSPYDYIRCDQLLYFVDGAQGTHVYSGLQSGGDAAEHQGLAPVSRVYFGHGISFGEKSEGVDMGASQLRAPDPLYSDFYPWNFGQSLRFGYTIFEGDNFFELSGTSNFPRDPSDARSWPLVRQPVLMIGDDGGRHYSYAGGSVLTGRSLFLFDPQTSVNALEVRSGRVDAVGMGIHDLRDRVRITDLDDPAHPVLYWEDGANDSQRNRIIDPANGLLYFPRVERTAPSMSRVDHALTNHVLGTACSSVRIEWTYKEGTGGGYNQYGAWYDGFSASNVDFGQRDAQTPWFGLEQSVNPDAHPLFTDYAWAAPDTIDTDNIERVYTMGPGNRIRVYEAVFGFNRETKFDASGSPDKDLGYTPWPSALRVTMTLHDPKLNIERGREVQFVIDLPERIEP